MLSWIATIDLLHPKKPDNYTEGIGITKIAEVKNDGRLQQIYLYHHWSKSEISKPQINLLRFHLSPVETHNLLAETTKIQSGLLEVQVVCNGITDHKQLAG